MAQGSLPNQHDMEVDLRRQLNDVFGEFDDFAGLVGGQKQLFGVVPTSGVMRGLTPYSANRLPSNSALPSATHCLQEMKNVPPLIPPLQVNRVEMENLGCASEASSSYAHMNDEENDNSRKKRKMNGHEEDGDGPIKRREKKDDNKMMRDLFDDDNDEDAEESKDRGNTMPRQGIRKLILNMQVEPLIPPIDADRILKKREEDEEREDRERGKKKDELERRKSERIEDEDRQKKRDEEEEKRKKKEDEDERKRKRDEEERRKRKDDDERKRKRDDEERDKEKIKKEIENKRKRKDDSGKEEEERRTRKEKKRMEKEERRRKEEEEDKLQEEEKERKKKEEEDEKRRIEEEEIKREKEDRKRDELIRQAEEEKKREAEQIKIEEDKKIEAERIRKKEEEVRKREAEERSKREEGERKKKEEEDRIKREKKREEEKRRSKEELKEKKKNEHDEKGRKETDERGKKEKDERGKKEKKERGERGSLPLDGLSHSKLEVLKEKEMRKRREKVLSESKDEKSTSLSLWNERKKRELKEEKMKDSNRILKKEESSARSSPMSSKNSSRVATPIPPLSLPSTSTHHHGESITPSSDVLFFFPHCPSSSCLASAIIPTSPHPFEQKQDSEGYTAYAKERKHRGDASQDRHHRFFYYMESSLYFALSVSTCHPSKSSDRELSMAGCVLKETFDLIKHAIFLFEKEKEGNSHFLSRARVLCARIQAVLSYHMYFVRTNKLPRRGETLASLESQIQEVPRESPKKEENGGSGGKKIGDKNITPSTSSTSIASSSSNMVTMPMSLWKMKSSQVSTYTHLELSHQRWNDSIKLVTSSEKHYWNIIDNLILHSFDWGCPLQIGSSLLHLSYFINTAVYWMRSEYDAEKSR